MIEFRVLSYDAAERIRQWRNADLSHLRTPHLLTEGMQERWYREVVDNRGANARWWGVCWDRREYDAKAPIHNRIWYSPNTTDEDRFWLVGCVGLENIEWENRRAEVSLLVSPDVRKGGVGREAVRQLLWQAWSLNLDSVYGEVYECGAVGFWRKVLPEHTVWAHLPQTKWWGGRYYGSEVFTVTRLGSPAKMHDAHG